MSSINIIPIGSGSTGNCIYLEIGAYPLLIDMGIGYRRVRDVLQKHGRDLSDVKAIFLTHGHYDHVKAAPAIANHSACNIYCDESAMYPIRKIDENRRIVHKINEIAEVLPGLIVSSFSVPHDYVRTCGYTFTFEGRKVSLVTDCGQMSEDIISNLIGSDVVIIECNHDVEMLKKGPYPYLLQKRILSKFGHLSNDDCADTVFRLYQEGTKHFLLAHVSLINNTFEIAYQTVKDRTEGCDLDLYVCKDEGDDLLTY